MGGGFVVGASALLRTIGTIMMIAAYVGAVGDINTDCQAASCGGLWEDDTDCSSWTEGQYICYEGDECGTVYYSETYDPASEHASGFTGFDTSSACDAYWE